jgi:hypothetical protein
MNQMPYVEIGSYQIYKHHQRCGGDVFYSQKVTPENRFISVCSDGLGSGVKANVLATLTSTMAMNFISSFKDIQRAAEIIMRTLPVCSVRKISYSTFTIADIDCDRHVRVIEYENPRFLLIRNGRLIDLYKTPVSIKSHQGRKQMLTYTDFQAQLGDRIVFYSDGISQSGMGQSGTPLGWGEDEASRYALSLVDEEPDLTSREMARRMAQRAFSLDHYQARDDITCGVITFRQPRKMLLVSGPPFDKNRDSELAARVDGFNDTTVLCGGTTAHIVARELDRQVEVDISRIDPDIPPLSKMEGVDLVTEGILTIGKVAEILESGASPEQLEDNAATRIVSALLNSDSIELIVGTRVNNAHQDPSLPVELEIRRNVMKKIAVLLEHKYLKDITLNYI